MPSTRAAVQRRAELRDVELREAAAPRESISKEGDREPLRPMPSSSDRARRLLLAAAALVGAALGLAGLVYAATAGYGPEVASESPEQAAAIDWKVRPRAPAPTAPAPRSEPRGGQQTAKQTKQRQAHRAPSVRLALRDCARPVLAHCVPRLTRRPCVHPARCVRRPAGGPFWARTPSLGSSAPTGCSSSSRGRAPTSTCCPPPRSARARPPTSP
eukprot:5731202-Prymnesium_polylepis.1